MLISILGAGLFCLFNVWEVEEETAHETIAEDSIKPSLGAPRLVYLQVNLLANSFSFQPFLTNGHARKQRLSVSYDSQRTCICVQALLVSAMLLYPPRDTWEQPEPHPHLPSIDIHYTGCMSARATIPDLQLRGVLHCSDILSAVEDCLPKHRSPLLILGSHAMGGGPRNE